MSNTNCSNCGSVISCGCQRRTASDGTPVCSSCVSVYEQKFQTNLQDAQTQYVWVDGNLVKLNPNP
jgi:hypothetical protein